MSDNMDDLIKNVKNMVDSGNIPEDIKQMINNLNYNSNIENQQTQNNNNSFNNNNTSNIDPNTILKIYPPPSVNIL